MATGKTLPSTMALRVLLAVAERGSTNAAAESINLSQSAVSKQLLTLERTIGSPAFSRTPHGMVPTAVGEIYIEHARKALKELEDAALRVARMRPGPRVLRLHVLPIFGDRWLLARLQSFTEAHADIDIQFTSLSAASEVEPSDGRFSFLDHAPDGEISHYLFGRDVLLVSAPSYWKKLGFPETIDDVAKGVMLEHPRTPLHWTHFCAANDRDGLDVRHITHFGYYTMVIRAALAGQGMALVPRGLMLEDLAAGRLVNPAGLGYRSAYGYWFSKPSGHVASRSLEIFEDWILKAAEGMGD